MGRSVCAPPEWVCKWASHLLLSLMASLGIGTAMLESRLPSPRVPASK